MYPHHPFETDLCTWEMLLRVGFVIAKGADPVRLELIESNLLPLLFYCCLDIATKHHVVCLQRYHKHSRIQEMEYIGVSQLLAFQLFLKMFYCCYPCS